MTHNDSQTGRAWGPSVASATAGILVLAMFIPLGLGLVVLPLGTASPAWEIFGVLAGSGLILWAGAYATWLFLPGVSIRHDVVFVRSNFKKHNLKREDIQFVTISGLASLTPALTIGLGTSAGRVVRSRQLAASAGSRALRSNAASLAQALALPLRVGHAGAEDISPNDSTALMVWVSSSSPPLVAKRALFVVCLAFAIALTLILLVTVWHFDASVLGIGLLLLGIIMIPVWFGWVKSRS